MTEHWHPSREPADPPAEGTEEPTPAWGTAPAPVPGAPDGPPTAQTPPTGTYPATPPPGTYPAAPSHEPAPMTPAATWSTPQGPSWGTPPPIALPPSGGWGMGAGGNVPPGGGWPPPPYAYPAPPPAAAAARKNHSGALVGLASLVAAIALLAGAGIGHLAWPSDTTTSAVGNPATGSGQSGGAFNPGTGSGSPNGSSSGGSTSTGAGAPANISSIAGKVDPGLVDINTNLSYQDEQAAGTGMVLTSNGEVLTNNHVIDGATSISVTDVGNGRTYKANVVGYDRHGDVAVIQLVGASGLQTITPDTGSVSVGEAVVGLGNAGGTGGTPSAAGGSVTATNQSITASDDSGGNAESLTGLIEINAGIQPGDSGGSLVNTSGQVVGMDTAASSGTAYQVTTAQAYAIPIQTALTLARQIEAGRQTSIVHIGATGFLGIRVEDSSASASGGFGSGFGGGTQTNGAVVDSALAGSPGAQAGLTQGDVITSLDGSAVNTSSDLTNLLESHHPGDSVTLGWTDPSGVTHTSTVTLTTGPPA